MYIVFNIITVRVDTRRRNHTAVLISIPAFLLYILIARRLRHSLYVELRFLRVTFGAHCARALFCNGYFPRAIKFG